MLKKTFAAVAVAGLLVLGGASAATAYSEDEVNVTAGSASITVGGSTVITATGLGELETAFFGTDGTPGGTLSSLVFAAATNTVAKPVVNGTASATFTASAAGTFVIAVGDGENVLGTTTVTVTAAGAGGGTGGTGGTLPATGSEVPTTALWLGIGAIGLGGIAVAAAVARRRASSNR